MRRLALTALAGISASACLLFTSLDDVSGGGAPDASTPDGAADSDAGVLADGATGGEGATGDAANGVDAGPCSIDGGDVFCANFDVGTLEQGWDGFSTPNGTFVVDSNASVSPPRSALANLASTGSYIQGPILDKDISAPFTSLKCSVAFRRDVLGNAATTFFQLIVGYEGNDGYTASTTTDTASGEFLVNRYVDGGNLALRSAAVPVAFPTGEWHVFAIDATATHARLLVDGTEVASLAHDFTTPPTGARLRVGLFDINSGAATSWTARYDDVRCTATP